MTFLPNTSEETYKTDKTDPVSNQDFLDAIFGQEISDTLPLLVSFQGNPQKIAKSSWYGNPKQLGNILPADANNYFSLGAFRPDESGHYRRRKAQFSALHAVMLDDVGTKVEQQRLTLPPSWLLETSQGNYQAGYILAEPLKDSVTADRLMKAVIAAGLSDPGADGPTARLARLPIGINGKHNPAFPCCMKKWNPERRYTLEELIGGLELDMRAAGRHKGSASGQKTDRPDGGDPIFFAAPTENAVLAALKARGLYKSTLGNGKHDITCPWVAEHTDTADGGTAYFEPDDTHPIGGFKCFHGHCANRHIRDLLQFLNVEAAAARMKPSIRIIGGEIHRIVDVAEQELAKTGRYYQCGGGRIVIIHTDSSTRETSICDVGQSALVGALASVATWEKYDARSKERVRIDPPARHAAVLYDASNYKHLPTLNGLTRQPYLRQDGTLATKAGYDPITGLYGVFAEKDFSVPEQPTPEDADAALHLIDGLLEEFCFKSPSDRSAAMTAILTAVIRPSLPTAPMFHVRAPQISSGKSFLCEVITAFATPQRGAPTTFPENDEECKKILLAELLRSPAVIEFDNLTSDLVAHKSLCTALTSEHMAGRILGVSKMATVSTRTLFLSSGNNVGPVQDMARRCITINLDPACEVPAARTFKRPNLLTEILRERGRYVSAALTIIRAWIVTGRPMNPCRALATYSDWSDICRQPLLGMFLYDPTESLFESMQNDPDRDTLGRLLEAWLACFGRKPTMVRDAVNLTMATSLSINPQACQDLRDILSDIASERDGINRLRLGRWIKRNHGKIVNGMRFVRASGSRSAEAWYVETVS